jgi:DNA-binding beta-propeller fold protein YncE
LFFGTSAQASPVAYLTHYCGGYVNVVDTTNDTVTSPPLKVGNEPFGLVVNPLGSRVYVTNLAENAVSVIDTTKINTRKFNCLKPRPPVHATPMNQGVIVSVAVCVPP